MSALQKQSNNNFIDMLNKSKEQFAAALPKHIPVDRMVRVALTEFRKNPSLQKCQPISVMKCFIEAAQLGLEPGVQGQAYLVPFKDECTFIPGYRGLIHLARRSGEISVIDAQAVYEGDEFDVTMGTEPSLSHKPKFKSDSATHYYAVCLLKDGGKQFVVMSKEQVEAHRDKYSKQFQYKGQGPWKDSFDEMAKKTVLRRLCKMIPQSVELMGALSHEDEVYETIDVEPTKEELEQNREKTLSAETIPAPSDHLAIMGQFKDLAQTALKLEIDTSDLYKSINEGLAFKPQAILAVCELLRERINFATAIS